MDKRINTICTVAKKNGWLVKYRYTDEQRDEITGIELNNVVFAFHAESPRGVGFNFQVSVPNCGDVEKFRENVSMEIYDFWKSLDAKKETCKYLEKIGCTDSSRAREIYDDIVSCKYMIYSLFFNI